MTTAKKHPPQYFVCPWDVVTAASIQALQRGEATPEQQRGALTWIINQAAATYNVTFDPDSDRATAFAEGKRFVGLQLVKLCAMNTRAFTKDVKE